MSTSEKDTIYENIKHLYPLSSEGNQLPELLNSLMQVNQAKLRKNTDARYGQLADDTRHDKLLHKYSVLPRSVSDAEHTTVEMVQDLFDGVLRWRSPNLQHNVGAPVNTVASAMYALALDENIYSIDDGLAGNALMAERAVSNILSKLADLDQPGAGLFVFGGTATNFYASKIGLQKSCPQAAKDGVPTNVKMFVTAEAHFTHRLSADWQGIGTKNVVEISANPDRTSDIADAEAKLRMAIENGDIITSIILNGGTTYNHVVDDITAFVTLREQLIKDYKLTYRPHIHVDAVIGWSWLFFNDYDFQANPLDISTEALAIIKEQYDTIAGLKAADSWGVDFHKGVGGCPVDCSMIMLNNPHDLGSISKSTDLKLATHQLATELTNHAPSEFTLETSRSAGTGLAALATLRTLGSDGYRRNLANLIESTVVLRKLIEQRKDMRIVNNYSRGYSTMVRIYPPAFTESAYPDRDLTANCTPEEITAINEYIKAFYKWDFDTRIVQNEGVSPSFSSGFYEFNGTRVSALKYYPTSPHYCTAYAELSAQTLISQKDTFDTEIWPHKK